MSIQVQSVDVDNDWFLGVTRISHTYSGAYKNCDQPYYPHGSYLRPPCRTAPWIAVLKGCCKNGTTSNYNITTSIDLSDYIGSLRVITFPVLYIDPTAPSRMTVCSLNRGNALAKSSGTIFWTADDNYPANYSWQVFSEEVTSSAGEVSLMGNHTHTPCALVSFENFSMGDIGYLKLRVYHGNSWTEATSVFAAQGADVIVPARPINQSAFTCDSGALCTLNMTIGKSFPLYPISVKEYAQTFFYQNKADSMETLSLRYIIATESHQSSLHSTETGYEPYRFDDNKSNLAFIPSLSIHSVSPEGNYVTSIDVLYQPKFFGSRPSSEYLPISYQAFDHSQAEQAPPGWLVTAPLATRDLVEGSNVVGNVDVQVIFEKYTKNHESFELNAVSESFQAVTDIILVNNTQPLDQYFRQGYILNKKNLLVEGFTKSGMAIFIMYRKGQGPPITDISAENYTGYTEVRSILLGSRRPERWLTCKFQVSAKVSNFSVSLYIKREVYGNLSKQLFWKPCEGENQTVVICANVMATLRSVDFGSAMQCISVNVLYTLPPTVTSSQQIFKATMGKLVRRNDPPFSLNTQVPSIGISRISGTSLFPEEELLGDHNWKTSRTGLMLLGGDMQTFESFTKDMIPTLSNLPDSNGYLLWTPNYFHGGWVGEICLKSCVESSPCAANLPVSYCTEHCIQVQVERCVWYLQPSDSIVSIATRFKTNWLQIWNLNPHVRDPSAIQLLGDDTISRTANVGNIYRPQWEETVSKPDELF
eukprot:763026-Hanusia_phi.AAC.8